MQYMLKDLFDNLEITMAELKRRSGISDVTLGSIRNGHSARRSTINKLLRTFSEIYGVKLTLKNVDGIIIQGKPVNTAKQATMRDDDTPDDLPSDTIKLVDFVNKYGLDDTNISRWINKGLEGEKLKTEPRIGRNGRTQHFLTPDLQNEALDYLRRHGKLKIAENVRAKREQSEKGPEQE